MGPPEGGQLATVLSQSHRPQIINPPSISTILHVNGQFLIDSGAVMSVVCYKFLAGLAGHNIQITKQATTAVGAGGTPLNVVGHTILTVS